MREENDLVGGGGGVVQPRGGDLFCNLPNGQHFYKLILFV